MLAELVVVGRAELVVVGRAELVVVGRAELVVVGVVDLIPGVAPDDAEVIDDGVVDLVPDAAGHDAEIVELVLLEAVAHVDEIVKLLFFDIGVAGLLLRGVAPARFTSAAGGRGKSPLGFRGGLLVPVTLTGSPCATEGRGENTMIGCNSNLFGRELSGWILMRPPCATEGRGEDITGIIESEFLKLLLLLLLLLLLSELLIGGRRIGRMR